jgi:hypothetical protein
MEVPVVDRAVFERLFGVRRRRAIELMHYFGGYQTGRAFLIERVALIGQLEALVESTEFVVEQRRRQRLIEALEKVRRYRVAARVTIPVTADARDRQMNDLPGGVELHPGHLQVDFVKAEELLAKLYELSKAAANDYEGFRRAAEGGMTRAG